jgi:lipopolysaccharide/colanic/teichoic acid biosynthesis glycosyltransferase
MDSSTPDSPNIITPAKDIRQLNFFPLPFYLKRACDLVASCLALVILTPFLLLVCALIKFDSPGSIFHKQERVGLGGRHFRMWKFRTMVTNARDLQQALEAQNHVAGGVLFKMVDDPRVTRVGRFLRRYSIDELPQIINVMQGEMSIVGPRPLVLRDVDRLPPETLCRHDVLPGMTGLWQVKGRSSLASDRLFHWDSIYIQQWSLALDLWILLQTILVVLKADGSY